MYDPERRVEEIIAAQAESEAQLAVQDVSSAQPRNRLSMYDPERRVEEIIAAQAESEAQLAVQDVSSAQPRAVTAPVIGTLLPSVSVPSVTAEPVSNLQRGTLDRIRLQATAPTVPTTSAIPSTPVPPVVVSPGDEQPVVAPIPSAAPPEEDVVVVAPDGTEMLPEYFEPAPPIMIDNGEAEEEKKYFGLTPMQLAIGGLVGAGAIYMLFLRK
jgi:hypothetical protein